MTDTPIFNCISMLAQAVGLGITRHMSELLDLMLATGLSEPMCQSLTDIATHIPPSLPVIQGILRHFNYWKSPFNIYGILTGDFFF